MPKLVANLRPADRLESEGLTGQSPSHYLLFGVLTGAPAVSFFTPGGNLAGIAGVTPFGLGAGVIWMSATPVIDSLPMTFLRRSKEFVEDLPYDTLFNIVDARNEVHLKWLEWLGFSFIRKIDRFGPNALPVVEFARIRPDNV